MEIKVVCLNLWQGGILLEPIIDFLKQENADVLMLQEVYDSKDPLLPLQYHSIDELKISLNYDFYDFAPAMLDIVPEGKVVGGNAIFSKYPIVPQETVFFDEPYRERQAHDSSEYPTTPRNLQHVTISLPTTKLEVFNFQGVWDMDGDSYSERRKNMSTMLIDAIKDKNNVILGGDTNAKTTNKAMVAIEDHLHSVFGTELNTTFNMRRKNNPGYATAAVDMIFVSKSIDVIAHDCPNIDVSDHLPLVARLVIR